MIVMRKSGIGLAGVSNSKHPLCLLLISICLLPSCGQEPETEATTEFALVPWVEQPQHNLMFAAMENKKISYCLTAVNYRGSLVPVARMVERAIRDWLSVIPLQVKVEQISTRCRGEISHGVIEIQLYGNEAEFNSRTGNVGGTLGIFFPRSGILSLNMPGILNQARDRTGGYKTILHEIGHALGMGHSPEVNSVMYYNLRNAPDRMTQVDFAGIRAAAKLVEREMRNGE
jgi:Matrixin